jgi:alpha-beta hydrolase superfamily lysophospholipase
MTLLSDNPLWEQFATRTLFMTTYGGADFGECAVTMELIGDDGDASAWHQEWTATADRIAAAAATSEAGGHHVSARESYLRAAVYYRTSYQPLYGAPVDPRLRDAFDRERATLAAMVRLTPGLELVEIPFEGATLPGLYAHANGPGPVRGTIVHTNGYDSDLTEMFVAHVPAAVARGYDILLFDGPGQGRNLIRDGLALRPDWENVVGPVLDWVFARAEVDRAPVVLAGWSFGGFLAPRAAAHETRLAALIADPGQWDQRDALIDRLPLSDEQKAAFPDGVDPHALDQMQAFLAGPEGDPAMRWALLQRGLWVSDQPNLFALVADLCRYRLSDVADRISCPTLLTCSEGDRVSAGARTLYDALTVSRKTLVSFTAAEGAGGHCEATARRLFHQRVYDWLDETLAISPSSASSNRRSGSWRTPARSTAARLG